MKEKIGADAGRLWAVLNEMGTKSVKEVKKLTKLTDKEVYAAIGWLAREEKLGFGETEGEVYLMLL